MRRPLIRESITDDLRLLPRLESASPGADYAARPTARGRQPRAGRSKENCGRVLLLAQFLPPIIMPNSALSATSARNAFTTINNEFGSFRVSGTGASIRNK